MLRKALIVEDDPHTRRLLGRLIEAQDCKVDEAADGAKAIEMLSKVDYDVVLLDIVLPKLSG
ncbi:MAG TPA: response regulator, partial [Thermoanaerobaculia bacterium]